MGPGISIPPVKTQIDIGEFPKACTKEIVEETAEKNAAEEAEDDFNPESSLKSSLTRKEDIISSSSSDSDEHLQTSVQNRLSPEANSNDNQSTKQLEWHDRELNVAFKLSQNKKIIDWLLTNYIRINGGFSIKLFWKKHIKGNT